MFKIALIGASGLVDSYI